MESTHKRRFFRTKRALENHGFKVLIASTRKDAVQEALALIPPDARVGVGGSVTIRELGLIEALAERGSEVVHHWQPDVAVEDWLPYACMPS